jgi:PAS domain-containing protein
MTDTASIPTQQQSELLGSVALSADLVRLALDQLSQAVFLYRPVFDGDLIVELEIVYCNQAALDLPFNSAIVPGAMASEVFVDFHLALDATQQAWEGEVPPTYSATRQGVVHGSFRTIRFEITTGRAGDLLLQTAHDFTVDDQLAQSEARLRTIVQSLDQSVVLF